MAQRDIYIGKQIGNYRIEQTIASGSFGTVYLAQHLYLEQRIAVVKLLHAVRLGSDEEKEQFRQEARILEMLKDLPNILPLLDFGIEGDVPYMVTKYAERGSLRMHIGQQGNPLPLEEALKIIAQVGKGLQDAHDKGIVHRDLKPENILFDTKGEALLADFGVSTILSTASLKQTHVTGTPAYMAPEQFSGEVCKESDQYALACITYELLTGRKLFEVSNFFSMGYCHVYKTPTPPRQLNPQIPSSVEHALLKALSKERTERYTSVSGFVNALNNIENDDDWETLPSAQGQPISPTLPSTLPETNNSSALPPPISYTPILPPSTIAGVPTQPLYPLTTGKETTPATSNPIPSVTDPPMYNPPSIGLAGPEPVWSPTSSRTPSNLNGPAITQILQKSSVTSDHATRIGQNSKVFPRPKQKKPAAPVATIISVIIIIIVLVIGSMAYSIYQSLDTATVTIVPPLQTVSTIFNLTAKPNQTGIDINAGIVPLQTLSSTQNGSKSGNTTGQQDCIIITDPAPHVQCKQAVSQEDVNNLMIQALPSVQSQIENDLRQQEQTQRATPVGKVAYPPTTGTGQANPTATANPPVDTVSNTVTVTLSLEGTQKYIKTDDATAVAKQKLQGQLKPNFSLVDKTLQLSQAVVQSTDAQGNIQIKFAAAAWSRNTLTPSDISDIQNHIAGKSLNDARTFIAQKLNLDPNSIRIWLSTGDNLPRSGSQITVTETDPSTLPPVQVPAIP